MPLRSLGLIFLFGVAAQSAHAQPVMPSYAAGLTVQVYPAGVNATLHGAIPLGRRDALRAYAGLNLTDRRDWGAHEGEQGGGPGAGVAWRHYFGEGHGGFHVGPRLDVWLLAIDWEDAQQRGSTSLVVLQPTAQAGYTWRLGGGRYALAATAAFGAEVNVLTDGEDVGQGAILLVGLSFSRRAARKQEGGQQ